uniref:Uncharacterized protein n=1 Tax=Utricularia reniformis TaxID=192314 RepID=A0A1Y0B3F6_9LAMI|nr:hypothetical protein AEK19_MT1752 [Utricularia reniformis]ART31928.1 hypothetical protein AEK19_MT1752 [Utricularia reniformis]
MCSSFFQGILALTPTSFFSLRDPEEKIINQGLATKLDYSKHLPTNQGRLLASLNK